MKWSAEAKVGLVTIVGVLLFTFVVLTLAHAEIFGKPGFVVHTEFKDANGLQKGNSVRYVGVHVGKVESVKPSRDGVDVAMKLEKGTEIPPRFQSDDYNGRPARRKNRGHYTGE